MAEDFRLVLHLGAHKTATTAIQRWLASHEEILTAAGIAAVTDAAVIRAALSGMHINSVEQAAAVRDLISAAGGRPTIRTVIYSCEGHLGDAFAPGFLSLYGARHKALPLLGQALDGLSVDVVYSIRDQASLLTSYYLQRVKQGEFVTFADYISGLDAERLSWLPLLDHMQAAFPSSPITLFDYNAGTSPSVAEALLRRYVPGADLEDVRRLNPSYSARALKVASHVLPLLKTAEEKTAFRRFVVANLCGPSEDQPKLLCDPMAEALHARYQADLEAIRARYGLAQ